MRKIPRCCDNKSKHGTYPMRSCGRGPCTLRSKNLLICHNDSSLWEGLTLALRLLLPNNDDNYSGFTCQSHDMIMWHAVVGDSGLIFSTWGSSSAPKCTWVSLHFAPMEMRPPWPGNIRNSHKHDHIMSMQCVLWQVRAAFQRVHPRALSFPRFFPFKIIYTSEEWKFKRMFEERNFRAGPNRNLGENDR